MPREKTKTKEFSANTQQGALDAAFKWQGDFTQHSSLFVETVVAVPRGGKWVATVTYQEQTD